MTKDQLECDCGRAIVADSREARRMIEQGACDFCMVQKTIAEARKALFKTTIVIWSEYNPEGEVELEDLAREAQRGDAYCSKMQTVCVADPTKDPDWDGTEFFDGDDKI